MTKQIVGQTGQVEVEEFRHQLAMALLTGRIDRIMEAEVNRSQAEMINKWCEERRGYGRCPTCEGQIVSRERRPNGNDRCERGHVFPSREALRA